MTTENVRSYPSATDDVDAQIRPEPAAPTPTAQHGSYVMNGPQDQVRRATVEGGADQHERTVAMWAHLTLPIGILTTMGVGTIVAALTLWIMNRDKPFARRAAAGSFNAACTTLIVTIGSMALFGLGMHLLNGVLLDSVFGAPGIGGLGVLGGIAIATVAGPLSFMGAMLAVAITGVVAATRAYSGTPFRYRPVLRILQ